MSWKRVSLIYLNLCVVLICLFGCVQLRGDNRISDGAVTSAGIVIVDGTLLRTRPDSGSRVIKKLEFAVPFFILKKRSFTKGDTHFHWYKIMLKDRKTTGWIVSEKGREGSFEVTDLEKDDFAGLYYSVAYRSFRSSDYDLAERLFLRVLRDHSGKNIAVRHYTFGGIRRVDARIETLKRLAELYRAKKDYRKSVEYYEKIVEQEEAKSQAVVEARRNIMRIYRDDLEDRYKTVELCHKIIKELPSVEISGFEWSLLVDIEAAYTIVNIFSSKESKRRLMLESQKILSESTNPRVMLEAIRGKVSSQVYDGDYESAKASLIDGLRTHVDLRRQYYRGQCDFSVDPLFRATRLIINEYGDYGKAIELANAVTNSIEEKNIKGFAQYEVARLLDEGEGSRERVLSAYDKVPGFYVHVGTHSKTTSGRNAKPRIAQIELYPVEEMLFSEEAVAKPGLDAKPSSYEIVGRGVVVKFLYKDRRVVDVRGRQGSWAKVQLPDGTIRWVLDAFLDPVVKKPLFPPLERDQEIWSMPGADINHTSAVRAKPIKAPFLARVLPNVNSEEAILSDLNGDNVLDILAYWPKGLVGIDGMTQKVIWSFSCGRGSIPIVREQTVYLAAYGKGGEYLHALDERTGRVVWSTLVGTHALSYPPSSPAIEGNLVYVGTVGDGLVALDLTDGATVWRFELPFPIVGGITAVGGLVYFPGREKWGGNDKLFALNATTGEVEWVFDFHSKNNVGYLPAVCIAEGILFCSGANEYLYAIDAKTGDLQWQTRVATGKGKHYAWFKPSVYGGTVFYAMPWYELCALDSKTGNIKWKYTYSHSLWGSPAVVDGALYIRSIDNCVHAISPADGQLLWKLGTGNEGSGGSYSPSIAQGVILIGSTDNNLYVIADKGDMNKNSE